MKEEFLSEIAEPMQLVKVKISAKFGFGSDNWNLCEIDLDEEIKTALEIADLKFILFEVTLSEPVDAQDKESLKNLKNFQKIMHLK